MKETHSVAAGLDYIGVGPVLSYLRDQGRIRFESALDEETIEAAKLLIRQEGIIPALESSHALAGVIREAPRMRKDQIVLLNLSGRGDKDIFNIADAIGDEKWNQFIKQKAQRL